MPDTLIIFKKEQYIYLKNEYSEKGYVMYSFSRTSDVDSIVSVLQDNEKVLIDISSLGESILSSDGFLYNFERLLDYFPEETVFITDVDSETYKYKLRHCFESFIIYQNNDVSINADNHFGFNENNTIQRESKTKKIIDLENENLESFFLQFNENLYGHEKFKQEFNEIVYSFRVFNEINEHKILSLFLMGDSGVGKTEVARAIYRGMGGNKQLAKINFGNYSSQDSLNSLIGSPRGYIGSDGGELFDKVIGSDVGLILIDEFEKANTPVFNYFLEVLETGIATNSLGEVIDLDGYIIIFTSNVQRSKFEDKFSPELRSRFDYKGYFNLLTYEDKDKYVRFRFNDIIGKYNMKHGTKLNKRTLDNLVLNVNVNDYSNMRLLNSRIKKVFVDYLKDTNKI